MPPSFVSRRSSFKKKLETSIMGVYEFVVTYHQTAEERQTLLVPTKFSHIPISKVLEMNEEAFDMPVHQPVEDDFLEMIHVALKLRADIKAQPPYQGFIINEEEAIQCVPDSVFMFLRLVLGGDSLLYEDQCTSGEESLAESEAKQQNIILSIGQDLVYNVSGGKQWTPKHLGLASTLHQSTRSKELVQLFHNAGHIISYENVLQVDTALAESTLKSMDGSTGAVIPPNFAKDRFVHFTCDNIDINDSSLDGKDSFHATQVAGWQRGPAIDMGFKNLAPSTSTTLIIPEVMEEVLESAIQEGVAQPSGTENMQKQWYNKSAAEKPMVRQAEAADMAFFLMRQDEEPPTCSGWTHHNQKISKVDPPITSVGYMPIIQAPAHDLDTLTTVVERCRHVARTLGQYYVVLTVDEPLYCKLMELKWARTDYQDFLILRLGGLHTSMSFLKVIGKHIQASGLVDAWVESHLIGPRAAEQVLCGKKYDRGMRMHKITLQAMWRIIMPQFLEYIEQKDEQLRQDIQAATGDEDIDLLMSILETDRFRQTMEAFIESKCNANFRFWWSYMQMVQILLLFTRAQREGNWELHLHAFQSMLPLFMRYDHTNYARWGTMYLNDMHQLPPRIEQEFRSGNFVVKRSSRHFNQVDPDQSQEWLNGTGKRVGGIVGITKTPTALSRWALSYNLRSHMSNETKELYSIGQDETQMHNESTKGGQNQDGLDEESLIKTLLSYSLFSNDASEVLQNIATKDLATEKIADDLLHAKERGLQQLNTFLEDRLLPCDERWVKFRDPLHRNKPLTFSSLYAVEPKQPKSGKVKILKVDRSIMQRLIIAYEARRRVDLNQILCHELLPVPISIAEMNGDLRTGAKAKLTDVLTEEVTCVPVLDPNELTDNATIIIDDQALIVAIGKPLGVSTFGDLSDVFKGADLQAGASSNRIDLVFDRYYKVSIKSGTRKRRAGSCRPIRRVIENRDVPLPLDWNNFLALGENKADLA